MPRAKAQPQRVPLPTTPQRAQHISVSHVLHSPPDGAPYTPSSTSASRPISLSEVTAAAAHATSSDEPRRSIPIASTAGWREDAGYKHLYSGYVQVHRPAAAASSSSAAAAAEKSPHRPAASPALMEARRKANAKSPSAAAVRAAAELKSKSSEGRVRSKKRALSQTEDAASTGTNESSMDGTASSSSLGPLSFHVVKKRAKTYPPAPRIQRTREDVEGGTDSEETESRDSPPKHLQRTGARTIATTLDGRPKYPPKESGSRKRARSPSPPRAAAAASARSSEDPSAIPSSSSVGDPQWEVDALLAKRIRLESRRALKKMRAWDASGLSAEELCERDLGELVDLEEEEQQQRSRSTVSAVAANANPSHAGVVPLIAAAQPLYTLVDSKLQLPLVEYRIRWKGFTAADDSWEPRWNIHHLPIDEFEREQSAQRRALLAKVRAGVEGAEEELQALVQHPKITDLDSSTLKALRAKNPDLDARLAEMKEADRKKAPFGMAKKRGKGLR